MKRFLLLILAALLLSACSEEEREFSFNVKGESTIALECRLDGEPLSCAGTYVEENYNYHVIFTIEPSGTVTVELGSLGY